MKSRDNLYKTAGVDIDAAQSGLRQDHRAHQGDVAGTGWLGAVKLDIGYFANVIDIGGIGLAICTDGVGSKAIIAQMMNRYDTIGIDCVAMNVNDAMCVGARPMSMVDYIAIEKADADMLGAHRDRARRGRRQAGISISGGEISQLKRCGARLRPGRHGGRHRAARPHHHRPRSRARRLGHRPRKQRHPQQRLDLGPPRRSSSAPAVGRPCLPRARHARWARNCCARP